MGRDKKIGVDFLLKNHRFGTRDVLKSMVPLAIESIKITNRTNPMKWILVK